MKIQIFKIVDGWPIAPKSLLASKHNLKNPIQ